MTRAPPVTNSSSNVLSSMMRPNASMSTLPYQTRGEHPCRLGQHRGSAKPRTQALETCLMLALGARLQGGGIAMSIRSGLVVLGVVFLVIACVYWLVAARSPPRVVPGVAGGAAPRPH